MSDMSNTISCVTPCPACGTTTAEPVAHVDGKTGEPLTTVNCNTCGLGRIDPLPTTQSLEAWYANHYRQDYKNAFQPAIRHVVRAGRNALSRWQWLEDHLSATASTLPATSRTLDIGASSGEFVYLLQKRGCDAHGIEPHTGYATHARDVLGLKVANGSLNNMLPQKRDGHFDLISMFHVLEHLNDPLHTLKQLRQKTGPVGHLLIEVPNATRFCSPRYMFFKAHTLYFTQSSLHQTLRAAGWHVVAHNQATDDNLIVLASPHADADLERSPAWEPSRALVEAQQRRTWAAYLAHQLASGRFLQKIHRRQEENRIARAHSSARAVLDHLYQQPVAGKSAVRPSTTAAWSIGISSLSTAMATYGILEA